MKPMNLYKVANRRKKILLEMSLNIASMKPDSLYLPNPNSNLTNFVIALGKGPENNHNMKQLFTHPKQLFTYEITYNFDLVNNFSEDISIYYGRSISSRYDSLISRLLYLYLIP